MTRWTPEQRRTFGHRMQRAREALGLTLEDLAERQRASVNSLKRAERGWTQPQRTLTRGLCGLLEIEPPEPLPPESSDVLRRADGLPSVSSVVCCEDEALGIEGEHSFDCPKRTSR